MQVYVLQAQIQGLTSLLLTFFLGDENWVSSALLSEVGLVGSQCALGSAHGATSSLVGVSTALQVELSREIGADRLRRGFEAESGGSWRKVGRVL